MATIEYHLPPRPDSCEACRYLQEHPDFDARREHTLAKIAQEILFEDLRDAGAPLRMNTIYVETIGSPGPATRLEPRHWLLALLESPDIRLTLEQEGARDA